MHATKGTMFTYQFNGETVKALRKFGERRLADSIARSLKAKLGHDVEVWYHAHDERSETHLVKWFDGERFRSEFAVVALRA